MPSKSVKPSTSHPEKGASMVTPTEEEVLQAIAEGTRRDLLEHAAAFRRKADALEKEAQVLRWKADQITQEAPKIQADTLLRPASSERTKT